MAHILIIDDEKEILETFRDLFEGRGYGVTVASDGRKGLAAFDACSPDVVITDVLMPDKEGIETIVELRKKNADVKIIAMSGGGASGRLNFLEMARQLGADEVISKPIGLDVLVRMVQTLLESVGQRR